MITITVETDAEEQAVRDAHSAGKIREAIGPSFRIVRDSRATGGSIGGIITVHCASAALSPGDAGGSGGMGKVLTDWDPRASGPKTAFA